MNIRTAVTINEIIRRSWRPKPRTAGLAKRAWDNAAGPGSSLPDLEFLNVRLEANDIRTATLRWEKLVNLGNDIGVYRSADGVFFDLISSPLLVGTEVIYIDIDDGLTDATKYWYKLSQDGGLTFSSVPTVVTYTATNNGVVRLDQLQLPRAENEVTPEAFNALAARVEQTSIKTLEFSESDNLCTLCSIDGAIVLDCGTCNGFRVIMTEDINSITVIGCDSCPYIEFVVPEGYEFGICGFPFGCDYVGDECFNARVPGGLTGRYALTNGISYEGYPVGAATGNSRRKPPCKCPTTKSLNIKCCTTPDCVLDCDNVTTARLRACGGLRPYTWSSTGDVSLSTTHGEFVTIKSTGTGGDEPVDAYAVFGVGSQATGSTPCIGGPNNGAATERVSGTAGLSAGDFHTNITSDCNHVSTILLPPNPYTCGFTPTVPPNSGTQLLTLTYTDCSGNLITVQDASTVTSSIGSPFFGHALVGTGKISMSCDWLGSIGPDPITTTLTAHRFPEQILEGEDNCGNPCTMPAATVTVTDAVGVSVTVGVG